MESANPKPSENKNKNPENLADEKLLGYISIRNLLEPAIIITLISTTIYYLSWSYFDSYYARLGLQNQFLDLPPTFYITSGWPIAALVLLVTSIFVIVATRHPKTRRDAALANSIWLVIGLSGVILNIYSSSTDSNRITWILGGFVIIFGFGLASWRREAIFDLKQPQYTRIWNRILVLVVLFMVTGLAARSLGSLSAQDTISGISSNLNAIEFKWKNTAPVELTSKHLVLIMHRDGKYFVFEPSNPVPAELKVYIINDDQIDFAITTKVQ